MADAIGSLGLDTKEFEKALDVVNAEMADLLIESKKLNAEMALLEKQMFLSGGGTKAQAKELRELKTVSEDFTEQIKKAKVEQKAFSEAVGDTAPKVNAVERAMVKLDSLFTSFVGISVIHQLATGFLRATEEAVKLNEEIGKATSGNLSSQFINTADLFKQIATIDELKQKVRDTKSTLESAVEYYLPDTHKELYSGAEDERKRQLDDLDKKRNQVDTQLAEKQSKLNEMLVEEGKQQDAVTKTTRTQLEYKEKIAKANEMGLPLLAKQLENEEKITIENIKQAEAKKQASIFSSRVADEAKNVTDALTGDTRNGQIISDREADKKQAISDMWDKAESGTEADRNLHDARQEDADKKAARDADFKVADEQRKQLQKQIEDGNKLYLQQEARKKQIRDQIAPANAQAAYEASIQTQIGAVGQSGHSLDAQELQIRQQFADRKRSAILSQNPDLLKEVEAQEDQALRGVRAAEADQTPAQRHAEERASRHQQQSSDKQDRREEELKRRAANGEHSKRIDDLMKKEDIKKQQDANVDKARADADKLPGWTQGDREYLKTIADAYKGGIK